MNDKVVEENRIETNKAIDDIKESIKSTTETKTVSEKKEAAAKSEIKENVKEQIT